LSTLFATSSDDGLPDDAYPLRFVNIQKQQLKDENLCKKLGLSLSDFHGGRKSMFQLYVNKDKKIFLPKSLAKKCVDWYHTYLLHPGFERTKATIAETYWWPEMDKQIKNVCKTCDICQRCKNHGTKYGELPAKTAESNPWERVCVDLIGPYTFSQIDKDGKKIEMKLSCLTAIDPVSGWFEIKELPNKTAFAVASAFESIWLTRYRFYSLTRVVSSSGSLLI
jgi:hypothetical protein